jgi:hypothetical protein
MFTAGGFESASGTTGGLQYLPYGWTVGVGTLGTTISMTDTEVQSVVVNGTPTGGFYVLQFTDSAGRVYSTVPLNYNASQSEVTSALQSLPGLSAISVATTGTTPNFSHLVTMTGVSNPVQLGYVSNLTGGSPTITITTPTPGSANVIRGGRALKIIGDSSQLTALYYPVTGIVKATEYAVNLWTLLDVVPAAGVLVVDLVDGVGGTVLDDDQATANTLSIDLTGEDTFYQSHPVVFRTPSAMPPTTYIRLRLSTAITTGSILYVDELCMVAMTEMYAGGLFAAAFSGPDDFEVGDTATVVVTNAMAGELHTWANRTWSLRQNRQLLPSVTDGGETQSDSLIA